VYIQYSGSRAPRPPGPFARIVAAIVGVAILVVAFFLGVVFLISALIALAIFGAVVSWRMRKYRPRGETRPDGRVLEGEWREVSNAEAWREDSKSADNWRN
jgi:predicted lipid-binding transport protein (Tim44 family)